MKYLRFAVIALIIVAALAVSVSLNTGSSVANPNVKPQAQDAYGYTVYDSVGNPAECVFSWISPGGSLIASGDDVSGVMALSEPFLFYGTSYTSMTGASNGYLSTDPTDTGPDLSNDCPLPATPSTGGGARIYPIHDDMISDVSGEYFASCPRAADQTGPSGCTVFYWTNMSDFGGGAAPDTEAILYHYSGEIVFQYNGAGVMDGGKTIGIQNDGASIGLTHSCNPETVGPGVAVCFYSPDYVAPAVGGINVPQIGMIRIDAWQAQPAYVSPSGEIIKTAAGAEIYLPADYDSNGYDTYVVTASTVVDGRTWYSIFLGNESFAWVPADMVQAISYIE